MTPLCQDNTINNISTRESPDPNIHCKEFIIPHHLERFEIAISNGIIDLHIFEYAYTYICIYNMKRIVQTKQIAYIGYFSSSLIVTNNHFL